MTAPRHGSMFSGTDGLDLGVQSVLGGSTAWVADVCGDLSKGQAHKTPHAAPCTILAHHHFDLTTPNLGDVTQVDWSTVEPVDVLTAGFPCQPVSVAGKRQGELDERWLWDDTLRAVRALRPSIVVLENVRGLLTARGGRLFGRVVGSLAGCGYDAAWVVLPASDVGAPHRRARVFIAAVDTDARGEVGELWAGLREDEPAGDGGRQLARVGGSPLLGTPRASEWKGTGPVGSRSHAHRLARHYLDAQIVGLPTPRATDGTKGGPNQRGSSGDLMLPSAVQAERWADYAPAIAQWERVLGRPAPCPTVLSTKGSPQLAPAFVEWMMGLPAGHVTGVPGITRNQALKALGNGVVPQQAAAALRWLLPHLLG